LSARRGSQILPTFSRRDRNRRGPQRRCAVWCRRRRGIDKRAFDARKIEPVRIEPIDVAGAGDGGDVADFHFGEMLCLASLHVLGHCARQFFLAAQHIASRS
jgi:hypothetical protein